MGISALVDLDPYGVEDLPTWPGTLPEPRVSYAWDEDGLLETTVTTGSDSFCVFGTPRDPACSLEDMADEFEHIPQPVREQAADWAYQMHQNVHSLVGQVEYAAHTPSIQQAVVSLAAGGDGQVQEPAAGSPGWVAPAVKAASRAETNLKAWFGTRDVDETTIQDVLTDLLHMARSRGITPADLEDVFQRAQAVARDEVERPEL